jgi:hypothetical protein
LPQERLRRGVGRFYAAAGLLNWGSLALLWLRPPRALWKLVFFGQFLLLVAGTLLYLAASYAKSGLFEWRPLVDFLIGVALFVVLLTVAAAYARWLFWLPGAFLLGYGWRLLR